MGMEDGDGIAPEINNVQRDPNFGKQMYGNAQNDVTMLWYQQTKKILKLYIFSLECLMPSIYVF